MTVYKIRNNHTGLFFRRNGRWTKFDGSMFARLDIAEGYYGRWNADAQTHIKIVEYYMKEIREL